MSQLKVHCIVIDPQVGFCDPKNGELYVPGAEKDIERIATMCDRLGGRIDDYHVTLDSHTTVHIAHPIFWKDSKGKHPDPFTVITVKDVESGIWTPTISSLYRYGLEYVKALAKNGRYALCIWNPHCRIGTPSHAVMSPLREALEKWELENFAVVDYVTKGSNYKTEHYSAVQADVPQADDLSTQLNTRLIQTLEEADLVAFCGEASTHCLKNSLNDIVNNFKDKSTIKKCVVLEDGTSGIPGFEKGWSDFMIDMKGRGIQVSNTVDFLS